MLFTTLSFITFFIIFFFSYWFVFNRSLTLQNLLILAGSYVFYCWWDWHFLFLLIFNSLLTYILGYYIYKSSSQKIKDALMYVGSTAGIGLLIYFKYTNFFITSLTTAFAKFNIHLNIHTISLLLPLGISFYTFRTLSYLFDIHKGKIKPTDNWIAFFSFVAFFPCLLAGPIDKAKTLIPQLEKERKFNYSMAIDGLRQIVWGLFKKGVIANNLSFFTDLVFNKYEHYNASTLLLTAFYYTIQLYADFSGYSDMAIGLAKLLGFDVTKNFNFPLFSQNIAEFWRKWHISLTTWLTDYVFTPLSIKLRDYGKAGTILAMLINFTLIGAWHGANWTFVLFGLLHGLYFIPLILKGTVNKKKKTDTNNLLPSPTELWNILKTLTMVSFANILFRSASVKDAFLFARQIFTVSIFRVPQILDNSSVIILFIIIFIGIEWLGRGQTYAIATIGQRWPKILKWAFYYAICISIFMFSGLNQNFIYFQF